MQDSLPAPAPAALLQGRTTRSASDGVRGAGRAAAGLGADIRAGATRCGATAAAGRTRVGAACAPATVWTTTGACAPPSKGLAPRKPPSRPALTTPSAVGATT